MAEYLVNGYAYPSISEETLAWWLPRLTWLSAFSYGFTAEGDNKSKQLLETLETFVLDAGMNSGKTSEFMGIHTNTVQYRLKKINEILGAEITGNRVIPGLTIALALRRMESASK